MLLPIQIEHYMAQLANDTVQCNLQIFERYQPGEGLGFDRVNSVTIKKPETKSKAVEDVTNTVLKFSRGVGVARDVVIG